MSAYKYKRYKKKNNYSKELVGYVYIIKLLIPNNICYKVGFTSRNYLDRVKEYSYPYELIGVFEGSAYECYRLEQKIHKDNKYYKHYLTDSKYRFSGYTEIYSCIVGVSLLTSKLKRIV